MKKVLFVVSLFIGMIAGAMVLSSFSEPKENDNNEYVKSKLKEPSYWQGRALVSIGSGRITGDYNTGLDITVYQTPNACNSFYAVITRTVAVSGNVGDEVWVRENSNYDSYETNKYLQSYYKYYITYRGNDFFFNM